MLENFTKIKLGHFPTPIEYLENLSHYLNGPKIFIKRDDCTGLATGGNKTRKLEFLIAEALKNKSTHVVTLGAVQSNHVRQTAAACAKHNLKCIIILEHRLDNPPKIYMESGNVFLDKLFGAEVIFCPKEVNVETYTDTIIKKKEEEEGAKIYFIPTGGSNEVGALGYVECFKEIFNHKHHTFDCIIHATGSAGTQAGLLAGKKYFKSDIPIIGISVKNNKITQEQKVYDEAKKTCEKLKCNILDRSEVISHDDYVGKDYGEPTKSMQEAVNLLAQKEGILLDPVYSGKAFAGLIDLVRKKAFSNEQNILFIHTGGNVSLFAYLWAF